MEYRLRLNWIGPVAVLSAGLAISLVTSTIVASRAVASRPEAQRRAYQEMSVKGSARVRVKSDLAVWRIDVRGEATNLPAAFGILEGSTAAVTEFLEKRGFSGAQVTASAIDTSTFYESDKEGRPTRKVVGYGLSRFFTVTSPNVEGVNAAAAEVTQLLRDQVQVESQRPMYYYTKLPDLRISIMGEAAKDARARAEEIAKSSGCRVGEVRDASMGVLQVTEPHSTEVSGMGMYETGTIEKDVTGVVNIRFSILNN